MGLQPSAETGVWDVYFARLCLGQLEAQSASFIRDSRLTPEPNNV